MAGPDYPRHPHYLDIRHKVTQITKGLWIKAEEVQLHSIRGAIAENNFEFENHRVSDRQIALSHPCLHENQLQKAAPVYPAQLQPGGFV